MSNKIFRWVGPGTLTETDGVTILHKPGTVLESHSLSDSTVDLFVSQGVAEYVDKKKGLWVKVDKDGKPIGELSGVDATDEESLAEAERIANENRTLSEASQALARPQVDAPKAPVKPELPAAPVTGTQAGPK